MGTTKKRLFDIKYHEPILIKQYDERITEFKSIKKDNTLKVILSCENSYIYYFTVDLE